MNTRSSAQSGARSAGRAARNAGNNPHLKTLARVGYAVNGLLHGLIGAIAISLAIGAGGGSADQSGALGQVAKSPGGVFVVWTIVLGLAALGLWQVLQAFLVPGSDPKKVWAHRLKEIGKGVAYLFVAGTALTVALKGSANSSQSTSSASATVLGLPGGPVLLMIAGLAVLAIGVYFVYKGVAQTFTEDLAVPSGTMGRVTVGLGVAGYVAKGIAVGVVGILVIVAGFTVDPSQSTGLDGALKSLAALPFGMAILVLVGLGLIAYGLYCLFRARFARL
ncbi:DUF1206 domain-containing protein [Cryobacterium sp. SO2]|uniref:DUF1206 domain-containing protein n=1 Tax=Cryobacterium sp. SO2 TaxID=1897060 RepID=UPI00223DE8C4|nr:DUF1206 domain-containing protein [Cryobacterium sp. SO2]WEO78381.1 DUF1206 domain-containing protein [Cryobacterium sp. SO2]